MHGELPYDVIRVLLLALDGKDPATRRHSDRVARYAIPLGLRLGLDRDAARLEALIVASLLHDVGNIAVPDAVLLKPSALSEVETATVRQHTVAGEELLAAAGMPEIGRWVRHHHERFDGTGYPDGLAGEDIPLESRIIAAVEVLEAMTTTRPYRTKVNGSTALDELERAAGTQFDSRVIAILADLIVGGNLAFDLPDSRAVDLMSERLAAASWAPDRRRRASVLS